MNGFQAIPLGLLAALLSATFIFKGSNVRSCVVNHLGLDSAPHRVKMFLFMLDFSVVLAWIVAQVIGCQLQFAGPLRFVVALLTLFQAIVSQPTSSQPDEWSQDQLHPKQQWQLLALHIVQLVLLTGGPILLILFVASSGRHALVDLAPIPVHVLATTVSLGIRRACCAFKLRILEQQLKALSPQSIASDSPSNHEGTQVTPHDEAVLEISKQISSIGLWNLMLWITTVAVFLPESILVGFLSTSDSIELMGSVAVMYSGTTVIQVLFLGLTRSQPNRSPVVVPIQAELPLPTDQVSVMHHWFASIRHIPEPSTVTRTQSEHVPVAACSSDDQVIPDCASVC